ncbi:unnamed protein product [Symbiodinium pilosum]|uniref:Uncharacterized protein n=1 Tax=Symbiodinium pilosum TaxID=2952 RepID=A0A812RKA6_SYMPI|nr:unnamed protein product [Symbiodinium pilosum]
MTGKGKALCIARRHIKDLEAQLADAQAQLADALHGNLGNVVPVGLELDPDGWETDGTDMASRIKDLEDRLQAAELQSSQLQAKLAEKEEEKGELWQLQRLGLPSCSGTISSASPR